MNPMLEHPPRFLNVTYIISEFKGLGENMAEHTRTVAIVLIRTLAVQCVRDHS